MESIVAYMDRVDFVFELGEAINNEIYLSIETLEEKRKCAAQCGIVEVLIQDEMHEDGVVVFVPKDTQNLKSFTAHASQIKGTIKKIVVLNKVIKKGKICKDELGK